MKLTKREIEVLKLKRKGLLQSEIAEKLGISQPAVSGFYNVARRKIRRAKETIRVARELEVEIE